MLSIGRGALVFLSVLGAIDTAARAEQKYTLQEPVSDERVFRVDSRLEVEGRLETPLGGGKARALDLDVTARHVYRERRLSGTGREAAALRTLRHYDRASSEITVGEHATSSRLRDGRRRIVAQGKREAVVFYSPSGRLTRAELDLLQTPGDSLAILGLLPLEPVELEEQWRPESWVVQMLTATEAVLKSELNCRLVSVSGGVARVEFGGSIEGATVGAATEIELEGHYLYDLEGRFIKRAEVVQKEERSVGTVSPGMKVAAKVTLKRAPAERPQPLTDEAAERIPLEPDPSLMFLELTTSWHVRLRHDRNWHVHHQSGDVVVLRLMENGSLIAQCNLRRIPSDLPGKHTPEVEFQNDIRKTLGERLSEITKAEQLQVDDGRFLYRVTAVGESRGVAMHWIYYLCAAPSGRQTSLVFAVESKLREQLKHRDLGIVKSLQFLPPDRSPRRAADGR